MLSFNVYNGTMRHNKLSAFLLGFPSILLVIAFFIIIYTQDQSVNNHTANTFEWKKESVVVKGSASSVTIHYQDIQSLKMVDLVEMEEPIKVNYFNGVAETKKYGSVQAYVYVHKPPFIILKQKQKTIIFNDYNAKATGQLYKKLKNEWK